MRQLLFMEMDLMKKLLLIQLQLIFLQLCTLQKKFFFFSKYFMKMTPLITKNGKIIIVGSSAGKLTRVKKDSLLE